MSEQLLFDDIFELYKFRSIDDHEFVVSCNKPRQIGLWTSTYSKSKGSGWLEWCVGEHFRVPNAGTKMTLLKPDKDARIYVIDTLEDLETLAKRYPQDPTILRYRISIADTFDYHAMSKDYDAIHLTDNGQWKTRFSRPYSLYGWDCETYFWFRMKFKVVKRIRCKQKWVKITEW